MAEYMLSSQINELRRECGDLSIAEVCRHVLGYSPYHIDTPEKLSTDVLIATNDENVVKRQQSYKFAAKLRKFPLRSKVLIKNFTDTSENERLAYGLAFLLKSLYKPEE